MGTKTFRGPETFGSLLAPLIEEYGAATTPEGLWESRLAPLGRTTIYELCNRYLESDGRDGGIPCIRVGEGRGKIIIPIAGLARWLRIDLPGAP